MELLAATYASSSSSDDDQAPSVAVEQTDRLSDAPVDRSLQQQPRVVETVKRAPQDVAAAREALAQRFALRATHSTHRTTADERRYAYRPYAAARRSVLTVEDHPTALSHPPVHAQRPLFSTLRALATPSTALPSDDVKSTERAMAIPVWQKKRHMNGHSAPVNALEWNPRYPPLFLSASMDHTVRVWKLPRVYYDDDTAHKTQDKTVCSRVLTHHTQGVKSAKWSIDGCHVWSGGYDGIAAYVDVDHSRVIQRYHHNTNEHVTSVTIHPTDSQLALFGTDRGRILQRDLRIDPASPPSAIYGTKTTGEIHDLLFLPCGDGADLRFISSSALTARDTSHQTLLVWDARSTALIADHLNNDLCSFTSLRLHPNHKHFVAQSTTSETVLFSACSPYKRFKPKHSFHGHDAQGFSVGCSFNAQGSLFASGDVHGRVVLYDAAKRTVLRQYQVYDPSVPCQAVAFHPQWASTLVSGGYDGRIELFSS